VTGNAGAFQKKVEALDGTVFIKISCGEYNTFAITDKGELLTWYGQS
jgi:hypothetical protein